MFDIVLSLYNTLASSSLPDSSLAATLSRKYCIANSILGDPRLIGLGVSTAIGASILAEPLTNCSNNSTCLRSNSIDSSVLAVAAVGSVLGVAASSLVALPTDNARIAPRAIIPHLPRERFLGSTSPPCF